MAHAWTKMQKFPQQISRFQSISKLCQHLTCFLALQTDMKTNLQLVAVILKSPKTGKSQWNAWRSSFQLLPAFTSSKIPRAWPWTTDRPWHCYGDLFYAVIGWNLGRVFIDWFLERKQVPGTWLNGASQGHLKRSKSCRWLHLTGGLNQKDQARWNYWDLSSAQNIT